MLLTLKPSWNVYSLDNIKPFIYSLKVQHCKATNHSTIAITVLLTASGLILFLTWSHMWWMDSVRSLSNISNDCVWGCYCCCWECCWAGQRCSSPVSKLSISLRYPLCLPVPLEDNPRRLGELHSDTVAAAHRGWWGHDQQSKRVHEIYSAVVLPFPNSGPSLCFVTTKTLA